MLNFLNLFDNSVVGGNIHEFSTFLLINIRKTPRLRSFQHDISVLCFEMKNKKTEQ